MKASKVLVVMLLAMFSYCAVSAQPVHHKHHKRHHVIRHHRR